MEDDHVIDFMKITSVSTKTTRTYYNNSHLTPLERVAQGSVADDLHGNVIGPMPRPEFYTRLMPTSQKPLPIIASNFFDNFPTTGLEVDGYPYLVNPCSLHSNYTNY